MGFTAINHWPLDACHQKQVPLAALIGCEKYTSTWGHGGVALSNSGAAITKIHFAGKLEEQIGFNDHL